MKSIKLKATASFPGAESKSATVEIYTTKLINGWWSSDKEGENHIERANLDETVYFHINTKDFDDGDIVKFHLREADFFFDDDKFNGEQVELEGTVKDNHIILEISLLESWEDELVADGLGNIEIYWEYELINKKKNFRDQQLTVYFSERTLYFKTPTPSHNLPEFISNAGDPMLLMKFGKGFATKKLIKKGLDIAKDKAQNQINNIVFTKLKKGHLVDNTGKVYTGKRLIYRYKEVYNNTGELFENVEKGKNFTYTYKGTTHTTKGISQYDYFSKNGKRVTVLGFVKQLGYVFDIIDLAKAACGDLDMSEPLPLNAGPLSPIVDLAGVLVQQQKAEDDMWLEETVQEEIDLAKLQGLETTRKAINSWNHNPEFKWDLLPISAETANKLLQGEFKTFEELEDADFNPTDSNIEVLYRKIENTNREEFVYVIETIFINE